MIYKLSPGRWKYFRGRRIRVVHLTNTLGGKHYRNGTGVVLRCKARNTFKHTLEYKDDSIRAPELYECVSMPAPIGFYKPAKAKPLMNIAIK